MDEWETADGAQQTVEAFLDLWVQCRAQDEGMLVAHGLELATGTHTVAICPTSAALPGKRYVLHALDILRPTMQVMGFAVAGRVTLRGSDHLMGISVHIAPSTVVSLCRWRLQVNALGDCVPVCETPWAALVEDDPMAQEMLGVLVPEEDPNALVC